MRLSTCVLKCNKGNMRARDAYSTKRDVCFILDDNFHFKCVLSIEHIHFLMMCMLIRNVQRQKRQLFEKKDGH